MAFSVWVVLQIGHSEEKDHPDQIQVPDHAVLLFKIPDLHRLHNELRNGNLLIEKWKSNHYIAQLMKDIEMWDSLLLVTFPHNSSFPLFVSLHPVGAKNYQWLFTTQEDKRQSVLLSLLAASQYKKTDSRSFDGYLIETYRNDFHTIYYVHVNDIAYLSKNILLIEDAIKYHVKNKTLSYDSSFVKTYTTTGTQNALHCFIRPDKIQWIADLLGDEYFFIPLPQQWSTWIALDVYFKADVAFFSGYSAYSSQHLLSLFEKQKKDRTKWPAFLTTQVVWSVIYHLSDYKSFFLARNQLDNLQKTDWFDHIEIMEKDMKMDYYENILQHIEGDIFFGQFIFPVNSPVRYNSYWAFSIKEQEPLLTFFREKQWYDDSSRVFSFPARLLNPLLLNPLQEEDTLYGIFFEENFILLFNHLAALRHFTTSLPLSTPLLQTAGLKNMEKYLSEESHITCFLNQQALSGVWKEYVTEKIIKQTDLSPSALNFNAYLALQYVLERKNMCLTHLIYSLHHEQSTLASLNPLFEWSADNSIEGGPYLFRNHLNQSYDLVAQDVNGILYLIDNTGKLLWKKHLEENIFPSFTFIDKYKNNKWQMLFNTERRIHLIDRNGNYLPGFPYPLQEKAITGLSCLDYTHTKNYRFLLPTSKGVINVDPDGREVTGWNYAAGIDSIAAPPLHFIAEGKDHIVFINSKGKIVTTDRKGQPRLHLHMQHFNPSVYYFKTTSTHDNTFLYSFRNKQVVQFSFSGAEVLLPIQADTCYYIGDFDHDKWVDFVTYDGKHLTITNTAGQVLFRYATPQPAAVSVASTINRKNEPVIALSLPQASQIIVLRNYKSELILPIRAIQVLLDNINLDDNIELITKNANTISVFQLQQ